jgi:hypothetical protein
MIVEGPNKTQRRKNPMPAIKKPPSGGRGFEGSLWEWPIRKDGCGLVLQYLLIKDSN